MRPERQPTPEECSANAKIGNGFAIWYPQMGGYVGRAVVIPSDGEKCFTAFVWHDGEFPFSGESPVSLHHCNPAQFVDFGETVARLTAKSGTR